MIEFHFNSYCISIKMKVLFIGDLHVKHTNIQSLEILMQTILNINQHIDCVILAGDVLDTHERVNVQLLNHAYNLIKTCRNIAHTFVIVGNHDYINNQQFLTDCHWMNGMKEWNNVTIVDKPLRWNNIILVPYVFPGRFLEALESDLNLDWKSAICIFAHQEFKGCKMGAFTSTCGDEWLLEWPTIISGHIHERQRHQHNIIYPGSIITHSFGGSNSFQSISIFNLPSFNEEFIDLNLVNKKTIYFQIGAKLKSKDLIETNRFSIAGTIGEIAAFKKTSQYNLLKSSNVKVVFRINKTTDLNTKCNDNFMKILTKLVLDENNDELTKDFQNCI